MVASDGLNENNTTLIINVADLNDLPPVFDNTTYVKEIYEESDKVELLLKVFCLLILICY